MANGTVSLKKLLAKILEQFNYDYVIEKGTSGIWTYQKWYSGKRECWANISYTGNTTTAWGNLYRSGNITVDDFPSNLFTAVPKTVVSARCSTTGYQSCGCKARVVPTATNFGAVWLFRTVSTSGNHTYYLSLYAIQN